MLGAGVTRAVVIVVAEIPGRPGEDRPTAASAVHDASLHPCNPALADSLVSGAVAALAGLTLQPDRPATSRASSCRASAPRTRAPRGPRRSSTCRRASSSSGSSSGPDSSSALRCRKLPGSNVARSTRASRVRRLRGMAAGGERSQALGCLVGKRDGEGFLDCAESARVDPKKLTPFRSKPFPPEPSKCHNRFETSPLAREVRHQSSRSCSCAVGTLCCGCIFDILARCNPCDQAYAPGPTACREGLVYRSARRPPRRAPPSPPSSSARADATRCSRARRSCPSARVARGVNRLRPRPRPAAAFPCKRGTSVGPPKGRDAFHGPL
jgi:hypothetical protein